MRTQQEKETRGLQAAKDFKTIFGSLAGPVLELTLAFAKILSAGEGGGKSETASKSTHSDDPARSLFGVGYRLCPEGDCKEKGVFDRAPRLPLSSETTLLLVTGVANGGKVSGHVRLERLSSESVPLGVRDLRVLWDNPNLIPEEWKRTVNNYPLVICFEGTPFLNPDNVVCGAALSWSEDTKTWRVFPLKLATLRSAQRPLAVVSKSSLSPIV